MIIVLTWFVSFAYLKNILKYILDNIYKILGVMEFWNMITMYTVYIFTRR